MFWALSMSVVSVLSSRHEPLMPELGGDLWASVGDIRIPSIVWPPSQVMFKLSPSKAKMWANARVSLLLTTFESLSKILPRPLRSRMLRSSKLVLNACQKNFKRNEISRGALTENDGIKNVEINEIMPVNMIRRASDWIEATRETTEVRDEDEDQSRDDEDSTNLGNFLQHGHEHASRHRPDDFLPINGFSSETGLKSLHYSDNEFDYHLLNIWPWPKMICIMNYFEMWHRGGLRKL